MKPQPKAAGRTEVVILRVLRERIGVFVKINYMSTTLLVIVYCILVLAGIYNFLFEPFNLIQTLGLIVNAVVLSALLLVAGQWALTVGIIACWVKMALGAVLVLLGVWEIVTLDILNGLLLIAVGLTIGIGLAYWTMAVLKAISRESLATEV